MSATLIQSRFTSPCPFCGKRIQYRAWIKKSQRNDEWMHPRCAAYYDAGKTVRDLDHDMKYEREFRRLSNTGKIKPITGAPPASRQRRPVDAF